MESLTSPSDALVVRPLTPMESPSFRGMTFPRYRAHLAHNASGNVIRLGAFSAGEPVGLALVEVSKSTDRAQLLSVFVSAKWRRQGVGTKLLKELDGVLSATNVNRLQAVFMDRADELHPIRPLLQTCDWSEPTIRMITCFSSKESLGKAPWLKQPPTRLPDTGRLISWAEMSVSDRRKLQESEAPAELTPAESDPDIEPYSSLIYFDQEQPAGWMINHKIDADTLRFSHLWFRSKNPPRGMSGLLLVAHSIWLYCHAEALHPLTRASCNFRANNRRMWNFLNRHLRRYLDSIQPTFECEKTYRPSDHAA